jgi:hypothetical protein
MIRSAVLIIGVHILGLSAVLTAAVDDVPKQKAIVANTEHFDLPAGVALRLNNSIGHLTIEAWDEPGVEVTTIKSSKVDLDAKDRERALQELGRVKITGARHGDEFVIQSDYPKYRKIARPFTGITNFDLEYVVKAPRSTRLLVDHDIGQVFIDGMTGDIHATNHMGDVELHLSDDAQYDFDARVKFGAVNSDFPGHEQRHHWLGHEFVHSGSTSPRKLYLRVGVGDIVVLKIHQPVAPAAVGR